MKYYLLNEPFRFLRYQYSQAIILFQNNFPIGINHEALEILKLCDGSNAIEDIVNILLDLYGNQSEIKELVSDFLEYSVNNGLVTVWDNKLCTPVEIRVDGSKKYWTPLHVTIELTYNCPLRCKHCFVNAGTGAFMKKEMVCKLGKELVDLGVRSVQLTGGEPVTHPYFNELLDILVTGNVRVNITTSGYNLTESILDSISKIKDVNGYVQVSLDGMSTYHNNVRGRTDAFEKTVMFIKKVIAMGVKVVVATCYIDQSVEEFDELCEYIKSIGVSELRFGIVELKGRAMVNSLGVAIEQYSVLDNYIEILQKIYQDDKFVVGKEETFDFENSEFKNCGAGYNILKIDPNGNIFDCVFSETSIGNITSEHGFKDFLLKNASKMFERTKVVAPCKLICGGCSELKRCRGCVVKGCESECEKSHLFS